MKSPEHNVLISPRETSEYITVLLERLAPYLEFKTYPRGARFTLNAENTGTLYLIRSGIVALSRYPDDVLLGYFEAPSLRGMAALPQHSEAWFILKAITETEVAKIEVTQFHSLLTEMGLWEVYALHLQRVVTIQTEHFFKLISPTVYDVIRLQLFELMAESDEVRESMTAELYIRSKARVSRASIMRILGDLKAGGYIQIKNGILKQVGVIPERY